MIQQNSLGPNGSQTVWLLPINQPELTYVSSTAHVPPAETTVIPVITSAYRDGDNIVVTIINQPTGLAVPRMGRGSMWVESELV